MDILTHIQELMNERGWSEYKLRKVSDLPPTTIANIFHRNSIPSIPTLEAICRAFGITISQFFNDLESDTSKEHRELLSKWAQMNAEQKAALNTIIDSIIDKK